jgi:hypothetical protein
MFRKTFPRKALKVVASVLSITTGFLSNSIVPPDNENFYI